MATTAVDDDLEEGEIVSGEEGDGEVLDEPSPRLQAKPTDDSVESSKEKKKKDYKSDRKDRKKKDRERDRGHHYKAQHHNSNDYKSAVNFPVNNPPNPYEDDFASNIEETLKKILQRETKTAEDTKSRGKSEKNDNVGNDSNKHKRNRRTNRKRRNRNESDDRDSKKKKPNDSSNKEDAEDGELLCIRGASPRRDHEQRRQEQPFDRQQNSGDEYDETYCSDGSDGPRNFQQGNRGNRNRQMNNRDRWFDRNRRNDSGQNQNNQNSDEICLFYLQGKCFKDDCGFSHDAPAPRKMELCKFYLMECCIKKEKCLYLHSDFPCKYYHTGLPCIYNDECKFSHGGPLSENFKVILLKHLESAPKEILGDFPKWGRQKAMAMINNAQNRLMNQYDPMQDGQMDDYIYDFSNDDMPNYDQQSNYDQPNMNYNNQMHSQRNNFPRVRQSRWCNDEPMNNPKKMRNTDVLSINNLNGVLSPLQISKLKQLGIMNLNQLSELTVGQLNQLGITISQINDIQLNTMNIEKLGLINNSTNVNTNPHPSTNRVNKDLDMRVPPIVPEAPKPVQSDLLGRDVDMRFVPSNLDSVKSSTQESNKSLDVNQYTKDALKFSANDTIKPKVSEDVTPKEQDVDHRVLNYVRDAAVANVSIVKNDVDSANNDVDIRFPPPVQEILPTIKTNPVDIRRLTTDDEEDGSLEIDEKWNVSDDEKIDKPSPSTLPPDNEPKDKETASVDASTNSNVITIDKLGDLSKIEVSDEVTKLMRSIQNSVTAEPTDAKTDAKPRDPRNITIAKTSPDRRESDEAPPKSSLRKDFTSIYDCVEGGSSERRRIDVDLRPSKDSDYRLQQFGDTDLRQTPGGLDVDFRLAFQPLTTTVEIDGSIDSHSVIEYKVYAIDIPKPDYTDIKNSLDKSNINAIVDPRLRRLFRLSIDDNSGELKAASLARVDPRMKVKEAEKPKIISLDLLALAQCSSWYKDLSTNQKILVNQQLAATTTTLKTFHKNPAPNKIFNLAEIHSNAVLLGILSNLGIMLNDKGEVLPVTESNPAFLMPGLNPDMFGAKNPDGMNSMSMPPIGNMSIPPPMSGFDPRFMQNDPRGNPGIVGMPPQNMPQGFDNQNYGRQDFNQDDDFNDQYDDMNYNYDDNYDDSYNYQNQNRDYQMKPFRRGGDRWGRGNMRGRDRRGYNDRGGKWNNDRR